MPLPVAVDGVTRCAANLSDPPSSQFAVKTDGVEAVSIAEHSTVMSTVLVSSYVENDTTDHLAGSAVVPRD
jgi:hypothetical protein